MLPAHDLIGPDQEHVGKHGESQSLADAELRIGISDRMPDDVRRLGRARLAATIRKP